MCQNTMNDCDISQLSANTGIGAITTANSSLDGTGATVSVFTAGADGSVIKSIIIKATQQTLQGMVRLFISDNKSIKTLYREVPIPIMPQAATTPVPAPQYTMYETVLEGDITLASGYSILASTQNTETFNVIVEGLDWKYPDTPAVCCNFKEVAANTGQGQVSSSTVATIFTADGGANGTLVKGITIKALQSTHEGVISIYISPGGDTPVWSLMQEVWIPQTTQSGFEPSYKQVIAANFNLEAGYLLGASTNVAQKFAITAEGEDWSYAS